MSILIFRDTCWPGLISEFLPGLLKLCWLVGLLEFPLVWAENQESVPGIVSTNACAFLSCTGYFAGGID